MSKSTETVRELSGRALSSSAKLANATIAVIGLGYVGLPLAILAAKRGARVVGFDISDSKVAAIKDGSIEYLSDDERATLRGLETFKATSSETDLNEANVFIICVPTPVSHDLLPDLKPLEHACRIVGAHLSEDDLVVVESTVNPGACEEVVLPILERTSRLKVEEGFLLAHCPERINPGDTTWSVRTLPRVLGGAGPRSLSRAYDIYRDLIDGEIMMMPNLKEAEAVKMVENAFRDVNIAFVNELAMSFDKAGIDLISVLKGASTKPFAFMAHMPGCGVGGHCIPVDPYYLIRYGENNGFVHHFLMTARRINSRMPSYTVSVLSKALRRRRKQLSSSRIALLGLSYKRNVGDMRESPALVIRELLKRRNVEVRAFDPHAPKESDVATLEEALQDADAAIIATDHSEFSALTPFHFMRSGVDIVIDGRNCLRKEDFQKSGVLYSGIGRINAQ